MRIRGPAYVLITLLVLGVATAALAVWAGRGGRESGLEAAAPTRTISAPRPAAATDLVEPTVEASPKAVASTERTRRVRCLSAFDRAPLSGVKLFAEARAVAGPSGPDGRIELPDGVRAQGLFAWAPGWGPAQLAQVEPAPEEVLLEPATASLQVSVHSSDSLLRIVRTRLAATGKPAREDHPWTPRVEIRGPLSAGASLLPAGSYQLYVWVSSDRGAPRPLPRQELEIEPGAALTVELEGDAPRRDEPDD